jgi:hypothetical protein
MGIRLTEHHATGGSQHLDNRRVGARDVAGEDARRGGGRQPFHIDDVFDPERDPMQRSRCSVAGKLLGQRSCLFYGSVAIH